MGPNPNHNPNPNPNLDPNPNPDPDPVELQAQALSHELQTAVRGANLLTNPPPREVSPYVEQLLARLRALQSSAAQVFPGEAPRAMLPQGPFPVASAAALQLGATSRG